MKRKIFEYIVLGWFLLSFALFTCTLDGLTTTQTLIFAAEVAVSAFAVKKTKFRHIHLTEKDID